MGKGRARTCYQMSKRSGSLKKAISAKREKQVIEREN
jgi:hypothetical protein